VQPFPESFVGGYPGYFKQNFARIRDHQANLFRPPTIKDNFVMDKQPFRFNYTALSKMMPQDTMWVFSFRLGAHLFVKVS